MEKDGALASAPSTAKTSDAIAVKTNTAAGPDGEEQTGGSVKSSLPVEEDFQYVTGLKLFTVIACITLVAFLLMLDQSIIATVCYFPQALSNSV